MNEEYDRSERLRQGLDELRAIYASFPDFIIRLSPSGELLELVGGPLRDLSISAEDYVGRSMREFLPPDVVSLFEQAIPEAEETGRPVTIEYPLEIDDQELFFECKVCPFLGNQILVIARNVSDRKRAEAALRDSEEKFRSLVNAIQAAIFIYDGERLTYVNRTAEVLTSYTGEELLQCEPWDLLAPEFRDRLLAQWESVLRGDIDRVRDEVKLNRKDEQECWVDLTAGRSEFQGTTVAIGTAFDITDRKRAEAALERLREELEASAEAHLGRASTYALTFRELTVLGLVARGAADKAIARILGISPHTVNKHIANILRKMNAGSRTEAGVRAFRERLLD